MRKYVKNLITFKDRTLTIQTVIISAAIDTIMFVLGSVASFFAKKAIFKLVKRILFKNKNTTSAFMKWLIDIWNKINIIKLILWAISLKAGAYAVKVKSYLQDFAENLIKAKFKISELYFTIISVTSFSGIVALLIDLFDGKIDGQLAIGF